MTWFPIGPDFVSVPRDSVAAARVSRRNELPRQTMVRNVVVDPLTPNTIYTVDTPNPVGSGAWRSDDGGDSWVSVSDSLQVANSYFAATSIAVNPVANSFIYLGTQAGAVIVSPSRGQSWNAPQIPGGSSPGYQPVYQILVDPRGAGAPATTVLYAATLAGLFRSGDGGATWDPTPVLAGNVTSIAAYIPTTGTAHFYASVYQSGVFHTTDPTTAWTPVPNLPTYPAASFASSIVQISAKNPNRVYAWFVNQGSSTAGGTTYGIYTSNSGPTGFGPVNAVNPPAAGSPNLYCYAFAITPDSPGDGASDVLLFASTKLWRSTDAGKHWAQVAEYTHDDQHSIAFQPPTSPATFSTVLIGCDGGLVASRKYADPAYDVTVAPTQFDDGVSYDPNASAAQNLDHGKLAIAVQQYCAVSGATAIGYAACQDTGLQVSSGTLGWRGIADADGRGITCAPGSDGVKVWLNLGYPYFVHLFTDTGGSAPSQDKLVLLDGMSGATLASFSNHVVDANANCIAGVQRTSMASSFVARMDQNAKAERISQQFGTPQIVNVAASPSDPTLLSCITNDSGGYRLWVTPGGALSSASVWAEPAANRPTGSAFGLRIASTAIDAVGNVYALVQDLGYNVGGNPITTPLFQISGGSWIPLTASGLPSQAFGFGAMVADPEQPSTLYVVGQINRIYRVQKTGATWTWTDLGDGLYGSPVMDLWIANVGTAAAPKVLLRAALAARGLLEREVTANTSDPLPRPYVRNHYLDQKWLLPVQSGIVDPLAPTTKVHHWQCPDVKVDAQQPGPPPFFQTDPEAGFPPSHVWFDVIADNSQHLPSMDAAKVHVRVQNRSATKIDGLNVWAIYANASAGVPSLSADPQTNDTFPFWSQFLANGTIAPALPSDSPWRSVGAPQPIAGLDVTHPQVASWNWQIPTLGTNDPGHFCMVVFLHGPGYLINESGTSVDAITQTNPQIGQKNLHVGAPLPMGPVPPTGPHARMLEYVEFHNPGPEKRLADLMFDLRGLPPELQVSFRLSKLATTQPLGQSLHGIEATHYPGGIARVRDELVEVGEHVLHWLDEIEDTFERHRKSRRSAPLAMESPVYRARPSSLVELRGVELDAFGRAAATLVIENRGHLSAGSEYRFDVVQRAREQIVGGSTYVVRIAGRRELPDPWEPPSEDGDRGEGELDVLPPALMSAADDRRRFLGRR